MSLSAAAVSGCSSYAAPTLSIANQQTTARTTDGVALLFLLDAENSNDVALPLREISYTLDLDGERVFTGTRSAEATLRRLGTQQIRLPVAIPADVASAQGGTARYRLSGTLTYVRPDKLSEILFDTGVRVPTVPFGVEGQIDLSTPVGP